MSAYRTRDGLSHSQVLALCMDREGTLWAGTKNGLDQFTDGTVTPYTSNEGLPSNEVGPVVEDKVGDLWIGTLNRGLSLFDGHRFRTVTKQDGLAGNRVLSLALDPSGDLWVGTDGGLNRIVGDRVAASYGPRNGLRGSELRSLFVDRQGTLWTGTELGLQHLEHGRFVVDLRMGQTHREGMVALGGGPGIPLFASLDGSRLYLSRDRRFSSFALGATRPVDCFWLDPVRESIWMGTLGSGLLRWKKNSISHIYVKDGLYDNRIYSMLEDAHADLWLASSKGIFRVSRQELEEFADGKRHGVTSLPFSTGQLRFECRAGVQPAACRTKDGRLWFSTTSGLVVLDPDRLLSNRVAPPVSITGMIVNGKRLPHYRSAHLKPRETNNVEIRYAGLSFIAPEKVTFRYKLAGYDRSWIDAGPGREAFFTNLPPGTYEFQVEARNSDGIWSSQPASLSFLVEPRLYQKWWFLPLLALLLGLGTLAGFRLRIRRLRHRFNLVLAERSRIARELHDTLLQGLSGITMQLEALWTGLPPSRERQLLGDIIKDAARCSTEARQSLWGLRTAGPPAVEFPEKLAGIARQAVAGKRLALSLEIEPVSLRAFPDPEYQLLRIAQEAISNSLKHAGALHLTVRLDHAPGVLELQVEDDGVGFERSPERGGEHFGLAGMRERAREIGAELSVTSSPEQGTRVRVLLPLPDNFSLPEVTRTPPAHIKYSRRKIGFHPTHTHSFG